MMPAQKNPLEVEDERMIDLENRKILQINSSVELLMVKTNHPLLIYTNINFLGVFDWLMP